MRGLYDAKCLACHSSKSNTKANVAHSAPGVPSRNEELRQLSHGKDRRAGNICYIHRPLDTRGEKGRTVSRVASVSELKTTAVYNWLIFARNSEFACVLARRSISSSIASTGDSGFSTLRSTQMRARSSFGINSSSF